jgi:PPOX class probable F420-dependent enzyme
MSALHPDLRALIESGALCHLATINADGSPQVTIVWAAVDGGDIVTSHMGYQQKMRNIARDPRVVLSFEAPRAPGVFLNPYAVIKATASIDPPSVEAWELLNRMTKVYLAPDAEFPAPRGEGYVVRYAIDGVRGVGPWVS